MGLKGKLLVITLVLLATCVLTFLILYFTMLNGLDDYLFSEMEERLLNSSIRIETEMRNVQKMISDAATSNSVQEAIRCAEASDSAFEQYNYRKEILSLVSDRFQRYNYILSIHYVDTQKNSVSTGHDSSQYFANHMDELYETAQTHAGRPVWWHAGNTLILMCEIRETRDLSLRNMGMMAVRIRIPQMINAAYKKTLNTETLTIYDAGDILFSNAPQGLSVHTEAMGDRYIIRDEKGDRHIALHTRSQYYEYDYYASVSYNELMGRFKWARWIALAVFALTAVFLVSFTIICSKSIVAPLRELTEMIQETPDIAVSRRSAIQKTIARSDEIGIVFNAYQAMLKELNDQIEANYTRKLLLKETQLSALQAQINPHFLYNTLDSVYWMAKNNDQEDIATMVLSLGRILRTSLQSSENGMHLIRVWEELKALESYLNIQQLRFGEGIRFVTEIPEEALEIYMPRLLLQPLIENSIHYGVEMLGGNSCVWLRGRIEEDRFILRVEDNGVGAEEDLLQKLSDGSIKPHGSGIGLINIQQRLQYIYEGNSEIRIFRNSPQGTVVEIDLPVLRDCGEEHV